MSIILLPTQKTTNVRWQHQEILKINSKGNWEKCWKGDIPAGAQLLSVKLGKYKNRIINQRKKGKKTKKTKNKIRISGMFLSRIYFYFFGAHSWPPSLLFYPSFLRDPIQFFYLSRLFCYSFFLKKKHGENVEEPMKKRWRNELSSHQQRIVAPFWILADGTRLTDWHAHTAHTRK